MNSLLGLQKSEKINEIFGYYKDLFPEKIIMEEINKNICKTLCNIKEILETLLKSLSNVDKIYENYIEIPYFREEIIGNILKELKKQKNIKIISEELKSIFHEKIGLEEIKKILEVTEWDSFGVKVVKRNLSQLIRN
jgi:predicted transcriptional regulator with HTH domain